MNQISELVQNNVTKLIIGILLVTASAAAGYRMYAQSQVAKTCIPTPILTENQKYWINDKIVGGPKEQWEGAKDKDGKNIANVYTFKAKVEKEKSAGYDMSVPEKSILVATVANLKDKCKTNTYVAYGKSGSYIQGDFKVTAATLYTNIEKWDKDLEGKWGILDTKTNTPTQWTLIGMPYKSPAPICESKTIGMVTTGVGENVWQYNGKPQAFTMRKYDSITYFDQPSQTVKIATGPATLDNIAAATIYCAK